MKSEFQINSRKIAEQKKIAKLHGDLDDIIDALDISINQT